MKSKDKKSPNSRKTATTRRLAPSSARSKEPCPIVGIGASAGGLEAFSQLLKHLPLDTGFGFVLVQHLDPQHDSALAQLLTRVTAMPVCEVTNNLRVEANHVYIIPPNTSLGIAGGILKLQPRSQNRAAARSIDSFFESLAKDQRERAIGVILSGTATDGTLGLEAIKAEGGLTFAQDDSARYDSMPRSAVAAGCVDLVLPPARIASELARISKHPYVAGTRGRVAGKIRGNGHVSRAFAAEAASADDHGQKNYERILLLLRNHCGVDFSLYKSTTIQRRITRRTVLNQQHTLGGYADFLRGNTKELDALYSDALISVTSFFRNADAFDVLQHKIFPKLLQQRGSEPLRVWVLGCSTGQEAYSIAMALMESVEKIHRARKIQVFATDLNDANLEKGRRGFYPKSLAQDISPGRLRRFFVEEEDGYRVSKALREMVVFARQNVISDPPFSRMDLISCRNLLIYFEPSLQKKVLPAFHYALKPGGFLFLGASESIGSFGDLFVSADKKQKIFAKKSAPTMAFHLPVRKAKGSRLPRKASLLSPPKERNQGGAPDAFRSELSAEREADRLTLHQFAPPGVLINAHLQILQFRGPTGAYLEPPTGKASFDLLRMARDGLMLPLRTAITSALRENESVRKENVLVTQNGKTRAVNFEVVPLKNLKERCLLVLFEDSEEQTSAPRGSALPTKASGAARLGHRVAKSDESARVAGLERDLFEARDYLQSIQEHQESANEELQASNEEGQSANEELQSLNEELETSKEELESTNEELTTVNEEMVSRNAELNQLIVARRKDEEALRASDNRFRALFDLGPVGVYSCDATGAIQEFNHCAAKLWGRKPKTGDSGERYCGSLKLYKPDGTFISHARCPMAKVLSGKMPSANDVEVVIERPDGSRRTVVVNIVPLKNDQGAITGAINCFYDITERNRAAGALREAQVQLSHHAEKLETLVAERTQELTVSNKQLETSIVSIRKGKDEYRALLAESHVMQEKLRHLTRQIITAQEEERKEISRELHDEVVQTLIAINVELAALRTAGAIGSGALQEKIGQTQRLVEDSVDAVHQFARGLRPAVLDDLGLIPALHAHCKSVGVQRKLNIQVTAFGGVEALNEAAKTVLFRVAQESLTNVVRHANATRVKISIANLSDMIRMKISDNGQSFSVEKVLQRKYPKRLGLIGMKERIEMIGGRLRIQSAPSTGTTVRVDIPFIVEKRKKRHL